MGDLWEDSTETERTGALSVEDLWVDRWERCRSYQGQMRSNLIIKKIKMPMHYRKRDANLPKFRPRKKVGISWINPTEIRKNP